MSKECNLSASQLEDLDKLLKKLTQSVKPEAQTGEILKHLAKMEQNVPGITKQFTSYIAEKNKNLYLNAEEQQEFNDLIDKAVSGKKSTIENLSASERMRLFTLTEKAQHSTGGNPVILAKAKQIIEMTTSQKPVLTESAIKILEKQKEIAQKNGDLKGVERIDKVLKSMEKAASISENLKIDWNAIENVIKQKEKIITELAFLEALRSAGDGNLVKAVRNEKIERKKQQLNKTLYELKTKKRNIINSDMDDITKAEELEDLDTAIVETAQELQKLNAKVLRGLPKKSRDRLDKIEARIIKLNSELQKINIENTDIDFVENLIFTSVPKEDWFISSARDLLQKRKKVNDNIAFVKSTIENAPKDQLFTRRELETLFGSEFMTITAVRAAFTEIKENPATKEPIREDKETINKEEVMSLFELWSELTKESTFDPSVSSEEARIISDRMRFEQREIITDLGSEDMQPVARTRQEAASTVKGYAYRGESKEDRIKLVGDLQKVLGRLNTLSKLSRFNGLLPEWALISALGTDAQSLFGLFDGALINPQDILYDDEDNQLRFGDDHQKRAFLKQFLANYGFNENKFPSSPENAEDFKGDFRRVLGVSFIKNKNNEIIGVAQTTRVQGVGPNFTLEQLPVIYSSDGEGKPLTREDAEGVLFLLEEQMNDGFKVVTHGALQADGTLERLILQSKNAKIGARVAIRLHDVGVAAFKGSVKNEFTRHNIPTLKSLVESSGVSSETMHSKEDMDNAVASNNVDQIALYGLTESTALVNVALSMQQNEGKTIQVMDNSGVLREVYLEGVTPLWMDGAGNSQALQQNPNFKGIAHLFDIQVLSNLKDHRGESAGRISMYDLTKVQNIATNLMFTAMEELDPNELNNILTGLVATPQQIDNRYRIAMSLSKQFHDGYIEIRRQKRNENDNKFIISEFKDSDGTLKETLNSSAFIYVDTAIAELFDILRAYHRKPEIVIQKFALEVGFRAQESGEDSKIYLSELFVYVNKTFNNEEFGFVDYGNGNFDYISAKQLGRGFAQVMLGFVREGNTLTQSIDTPINVAAQLKEELATDNSTLNPESIESNIQNRQYLPLTRLNVSFFAPLSMYEQERAFSDWALRKRYHYILSRTLTDKDRANFEQFIKTNRIVEFKNKIKTLKNQIATTKSKGKTTRLYRAEPKPGTSTTSVSDWVKETEEYKQTLEASTRWFTDDLDEAKWYIENEYPDGIIVYVDVPINEVESFRVSNIPLKEGNKSIANNPRAYSKRPEKEFFVSKSLAEKRQNLDKAPKLNEELKNLEKELAKVKAEFNAYMEELDNRRLEQGRVHLFGLLNPVNNRDLYTRIPTIDESIQMSIEVATELPQLIATYVHDSRNYENHARVHLKQTTYMLDPGMSAGGPGARSTLAGIHPLLGFMRMYPQRYRPTEREIRENLKEAEATGNVELVAAYKRMLDGRDQHGIIDLTPEILLQSLKEGHKARKEGVGYTKSTYFDDKFSGIHHLVAAQEAYSPSSRKRLLERLLAIKNGGLTVTADQLDDYYEKTYTFTVDHAERLRERINNSKYSTQEKARKLQQLDKVLTILRKNKLSDGSDGTKPNKSARDFFKGVVIPVIYSGGATAVAKDLKIRRAKANKTNDVNNPDIGDLSDSDIQLLADLLALSAGGTNGRLIDEIMDLDPSKAQELVDLMTKDTGELVTNYKLNVENLIKQNEEAVNGFVSTEILKQVINARIRYVAELSVSQQDIALRWENRNPSENISEEEIKEQLIQEKFNTISKKWESRIQKAMDRLDEYNKESGISNPSPGFKLGSEIEREINVILAGGESQYRTQASLLFLNKAQNSGYSLNTTDMAMMEHQVKTGRYIARDDLMFQNYIVFMSAAFGTSTGRMEYPGNYLANLQAGELSKGLRIVYKDDGSLDMDDTVLNSMWTLTQNPLGSMPKADALQAAKDLAIKNYSLLLATDYDPDFLGYDKQKEETRSGFFEDWYARSEEERTFTHQVKQGGKLREDYKKAFLNQQRMILKAEKKEDGSRLFTDEEVESRLVAISDQDIDSSLESNSVPFHKRETIRVLAPDALARDSGTIITNKDAKGLGAFIPRIADHDAKDHIVHGLYTIHHGTKQARLKAGRNLLSIRKVKQQKPKLSQVLEEMPKVSSIYDPEQVAYTPVTGDSLPEMLLDHEPDIMQKTAAMQNTLDTFAIEYGYDELVKNKDYARLYQIHQIHMKLRKLNHRLHRMNLTDSDERILRMEFRNLVLDLFKLTKIQRDATNATRNILDFRKSMAIDPSLLKYANGENMRYLDALKVLANLGIDELYTLNFGVAPTELHVLGETAVDVLKDSDTIIKPFYVQGHDVALLIMEVLANDVIKRKATEISERYLKEGKISKIAYDPQGFVILSEVSEELTPTIMTEVLQDDALVNSAANNLNLYVTLEWGVNVNATNPNGEPRMKVTRHDPSSQTAMVIARRGLGDPVTTRTRKGIQQAHFMLTAEAIKRILTGARNHGLLRRVEVSVQTNKHIGTRTNVDTLRSEAFREFSEDVKQQAAEEVEILERLMGQGNLKMLVTEGQSELKDEHGLTLNPYDAEYYWQDDGRKTITEPHKPEYNNMTPFKAAISSRIRKAIKIGEKYVTLEKEVKQLKDFYDGHGENFSAVAYLIFLKSNVKKLSRENYKVLVEEVMGVDSLPDTVFNEIDAKSEELISIIDKIEFSPTKGKNPYLSLALSALERDSSVFADVEPISPTDIPDIQNPQYTVRQGRQFRIVKSPEAQVSYSKDIDLKAQAIAEARKLREYSTSLEEAAYGSVNHLDIVSASYDPSNYDAIFPADGQHIVTQIDNLVSQGVITQDVAVFYRYLIGTILKTNPNLAPLLSITAINTSSNIEGSAIKQEDKFTIQLNTRLLKNMGTVDQVRVFAHEVAHIARMAFIKDNGKEWSNILSIFNSKKGKATIETMMLAMNNGVKYQGFDQDVAHYLSHPEEFAAQWGAWVLFQKTFNNAGLLKFLQSRDRGALKVSQTWQLALHAVSKEVNGIALGLQEVDEELRNRLLFMVDDMFGFTAETARQIRIDNQNNEFFMIGNLTQPISQSELRELDILDSMTVRSPAETDRYNELTNKYQVYGVNNLSMPRYFAIREERLVRGGNVRFSNESRLRSEQELEIIQTVTQSGLQRASTNARADHTFGGLTRNLAEKMFGVNTANKIISARKAMVLGVQSASTYDSSNPIIAALMNIIGDTFSMHSYQFQMLEGSQSIIPNRLNTRRMTERVSYEMDRLRLECNGLNSEFLAMREWAAKTALGITTAPPTPSKPKVLDIARDLSVAMKQNSRDLSSFIYGGFSSRLEALPVMLETDLLGTGSTKVLSGSSSSKAKQNQARNREQLVRDLATMIRDKITNGNGIDATVIYVMNLLPRDITNESLVDFRMEQPNILLSMQFDLIKQLEAMGLSEASATNVVTSFSSNVPISDLNMSLLREAFSTVTQNYYASASIGNLFKYNGGAVFNAIREAVVRQIDDPVDGLAALVNESNQRVVPSGVIRISSSSAFAQANLEGNPSEVLAKLFLGHVGNSSKYLLQESYVTMADMLKNPSISRYVDTSVHKAMYQIERTQGYMKTSEHAIKDITGVGNIDISQLLDIIEKNISNIKVSSDAERDRLKTSLIILREKLKVDQGLGIKEIAGGHPVFEFVAKWGPDVNRMVHGNNLNTASLMIEGSTGLIINTLYGGNPVKFFSTVLGTFFGSYVGRSAFARGLTQVEQRGAAVNLLMGVDRMIQDAREVMHISDTTFDKNAGKVQKIRDWIRQANNRGLTSVQAGMAEQGQWIVKKNLLNGNLDKLQRIVESGKANSLTDLMNEMRLAGIRGLKPHFAMIIIQSGILQKNVLRSYRHMLTVTDNTNTGKWGLDLQAAGRWIESQVWGGGITISSGDKILKNDAQKAVQAIYFINKEYTNIITVDANAFDSATTTNPFLSLFYFYRQYPNLFASQKMFRLAGRMDKSSFAALMISNAIFDLLYNLLLLVASGVIPLVALFPWSDEYVFKKNPEQIIKTLLTRNPIFSPIGNLIAEAGYQGYQAYDKTKENKYKNEYTKVQEGIKAAMNTFMPDFVALSSIQTLANGLLPSSVLGVKSTADALFMDGVGGKINEQEHYDMVNNLIRVTSRMVPGVELPIRVMMPNLVEEMMGGKRPVRLPLAPFGQSPFAQPNKTITPKPMIQPKPVTGGITPPVDRTPVAKPGITSGILKPETPPKDLLR